MNPQRQRNMRSDSPKVKNAEASQELDESTLTLMKDEAAPKGEALRALARLLLNIVSSDRAADRPADAPERSD
jgi:hypothetical protein